MLVLIPEMVNGKPLTLATLGELVKIPLKGSSSKYEYFSPGNNNQHRDTPAPKSHWILMTRDVIPDSRYKSYREQQALLKSSHRVPKVLEAAVAIFMQNVLGGKHGYSRDPWIFTRCEEAYDTSCQMCVGALCPRGGLYVFYFHDIAYHFFVGVAGVWKF